ncbi:choice-of-anchor D domain-containing protein [Luteolibacter sp. Populi]|uniref:choice-of-anchor D domain-containing protein n=1 Tax=Luteolibacter sp. Populi TaxID=3230487 RepID=UPI00346600D9
MTLVARVMLLAAVFPWLCRGAVPSQEVYLKAADRISYDALGSAVAISGNTAVVGAPNENSNSRGVNGERSNENALGSGSAYVFVRAGSGWVQQAYLKASNTDAHDGFGSRVAISGDTIVIGAMLEDGAAGGNPASNEALSAGAAYVFTRTAGVWTQQAYLKAAQPQAWDLFGAAVAIAGETIVVGAHREDSGSSRSGAAYVFARQGGSWVQQGYLKASDAAANAEFGSAVSVSGERVVVGAPLAGGGSGAVYLFQRSGGTWSQAVRVTASNAMAGARFGAAVSISGESFAIGARGEASGATGLNGNQGDLSAGDSGAVYVFTRSGAAWLQQAYVKASNTGAGDGFGEALALDGERLLVGAHGEDSSATSVDGDAASNSADAAGAAYLFSRSGGVWHQDAYLKASNSEAGDCFGGAVAISGDMVLAGAECESGSGAGVNAVQNGNGAPGSGAVYGFVIPSTVAEIALEAAGVLELVDGGSLVFATSASGVTTSRVLVVKNSGPGPLVLGAVTLGGVNAVRFAIDAAELPPQIAPGGAGILRLQFSGTTVGSYAATLQIASNDADEGSFDLALTASVKSAATLYAEWAAAAGLSGGSAAMNAVPKHDGVENLLKYAFRLNGAVADCRNLDAGGGLPVCRVVGAGAQAVFRMEYLRRKGSGLSYVPKVSGSMAAGSFVAAGGTVSTTEVDGLWERVRVDFAAGGVGRLFGVVEVVP